MAPIVKTVAAILLVTSCGVIVAQQSAPTPPPCDLKRAIAIAVQEEVRANHIENRKDVCLALDKRVAVDERAVLSDCTAAMS